MLNLVKGKALKLAAVAGVVVLMVAIVWMHGNARYDAGEVSGRAECAQNQLEASEKASKELGRIENETAHMSDDAIDSDLNRLGIMRSPQDR